MIFIRVVQGEPRTQLFLGQKLLIRALRRSEGFKKFFWRSWTGIGLARGPRAGKQSGNKNS